MATEVEWDDDELDPRIQDELETLNTTSEDINTFEKKLELPFTESISKICKRDSKKGTRAVFKQTLAECNVKLQLTAKYCGKTVNRALIYYQARKSSYQAQQEVQANVNKYQKAVGMCQAAKETIALAEEASVTGNKTRDFNSALQEMLNHATAKLNAAEKEREESEVIHLEKAAVYAITQKKSDQLKKKYSKSIAKSRVYYEQKYQFETQLLKIKQEVIDIQKVLVEKKKTYRNALDNLEQISEEIHLKRTFSLPLGPREAGVGEDSLEGSFGSEADSLEIKFNDDNDSMSDSASCDSDYFSSAPTSPCSDTCTTLLDSLPEVDVIKSFEKSQIFKRSSTTNSLEDYIKNSLQNLTISENCEDEIRETCDIESNIDRSEIGGNTEMKNSDLDNVKSLADDGTEEIAVRSSGEGAVDEKFKESRIERSVLQIQQ